MHVCRDHMPALTIPPLAEGCCEPAWPLFLDLTTKPGIGNAMWIIIRTLKGKNSILTRSRQWSQDRNEAERLDQFDYAVYCRDKEISLHERRGIGVVKCA